MIQSYFQDLNDFRIYQFSEIFRGLSICQDRFLNFQFSGSINFQDLKITLFPDPRINGARSKPQEFDYDHLQSSNLVTFPKAREIPSFRASRLDEFMMLFICNTYVSIYYVCIYNYINIWHDVLTYIYMYLYMYMYMLYQDILRQYHPRYWLKYVACTNPTITWEPYICLVVKTSLKMAMAIIQGFPKF